MINALLLSVWLVGNPIPESWLRALALVESNDNPRAHGRHGERTRYQITQAVWRKHSQRPMSKAGENEIRAVVLEEWWDRVDRFRARYGRAPTPVEGYLLWHRPARVRSPRPVELERARRFAALARTER
jgi:hypothetical protein